MRTLATFPGRFGDLLWALPTVRAIAETTGDPVDLQICGEFVGILPLLDEQPYLHTIIIDHTWGIGMGWQPTLVLPDYDKVLHLGYRRWPELPLPLEIDQTVRVDLELPPLDLSRPWITVAPWTRLPHRLAIGFSDCHFELKVGLLQIFHQQRWSETFSAVVLPPAGSRWTTEQRYQAVGWVEAARRISVCDVFLGDCSALHVLAVALGKPCVIVEPMEARHNPIFWPCGQDGPQVTLVKGLDGKPTFDARHCTEALTHALEASHG